MISLPLFGTDSSVQRSSAVVGLAVTFILWLIFFILVLFIRPFPKEKTEKFKTVQIVLEDLPEPEKIIETSGITPSENEALGAETSPVVETAQVVPVKETVKESVKSPSKTQQKKAPETKEIKSETVTSEPVKTSEPSTAQPQVQTQTAVPQPVTQTKPAQPVKKEFDWSMFDDDEPEVQTSAPKKVASSSQSAIQGTAGTAATSEAVKTSSSSTTPASSTKTASSSTSSSLSDIENAKVQNSSSGTQTSGPVSQPQVKTGGIDLSFSDGGKRYATTALSISLSDSAKKLIEQSVTLTIKITIEPDGSILRNNIIVPSSVLNAQVRTEIINSISRWHFDSADSSTTASFKFNIILQ